MESYILYELDCVIRVSALISAFQAAYDERFYFKGEMHDFWELVYVLDGKIGVACDDKIYTLCKGQIVFHKPMEFHRLWSEGGTCPRLIIVAFAAGGKGMERFYNRILQPGVRSSELILSFIKEVHEAFDPDGASGLTPRDPADPAALQLIAAMLEYFLLTVLKDAVVERRNYSQSAENYRQMIQILDSHIYESLSIGEIARLCSMSPSHLKKTFKRYSGTGIISYFNTLKVRKAISLLQEGLPISRISEMLSFSSQNYFSTVFKKHTGYSPAAYRSVKMTEL